ncbi:hypothetical protein AGMMS49921_06220 [Endomicrobiia bacterium]|nr:hypothetical protein AGMMS49921_06220 [Endomicrobiia bacterium]
MTGPLAAVFRYREWKFNFVVLDDANIGVIAVLKDILKENLKAILKI